MVLVRLRTRVSDQEILVNLDRVTWIETLEGGGSVLHFAKGDLTPGVVQTLDEIADPALHQH